MWVLVCIWFTGVDRKRHSLTSEQTDSRRLPLIIMFVDSSNLAILLFSSRLEKTYISKLKTFILFLAILWKIKLLILPFGFKDASTRHKKAWEQEYW